jgi:hypothetical protein
MIKVIINKNLLLLLLLILCLYMELYILTLGIINDCVCI